MNVRALLEKYATSAPRYTSYPTAVDWSKKFDPSSTWLQTRFTTNDRVEALNQMHQLQTRFPGKSVNHIEFVRIPEGLNPSGLPAVFTSDPREIDAMINFCAEIGVGVANPHSYVVKEGGMVKDIASIVAFKHETDPYGLLNPGKLDGSFYAAAVNR